MRRLGTLHSLFFSLLLSFIAGSTHGALFGLFPAAHAAITFPRNCDLHLQVGYSYRPSAQVVRPIESFTRFRTAVFNFENYVVDKSGKFEKEFKTEDDIKKVGAIAQLNDADILVGEEIENYEAATRFASRYLFGEYQVYFFPATTSISLGIAVFIKKDLPFYGDFYSHKHHQWDNPEKGKVDVHIRDIPTVVLRRIGNESSKIVFSAVHLKAKKRTKFSNATSELQEAQAESLYMIADSFDEPTNKKFLNLSGGDFNLNREDAELKPFTRSGQFVSTFDLDPRAKQGARISTQAFIKEDGQIFEQQVDAIFMNKSAQARLKKVGVVFGKDRSGNWITAPLEPSDLDAMGTDHGLVYSDFDVSDF